MSNKEIQDRIDRIRLETTLASLDPKETTRGEHFINTLKKSPTMSTIKDKGTKLAVDYVDKQLRKKLGLSDNEKTASKILQARSRSFIHDLDMQRQFKYLNAKFGAKRSCHDCLKYGMCGNPNADYSGNYVSIRKYCEKDLPEMIKIWNEVVEEGIAFPQEELLTEKSGAQFFAGQTYCAVAQGCDDNKIYGLYILHPNNVGRCGHICNASYAGYLDQDDIISVKVYDNHGKLKYTSTVVNTSCCNSRVTFVLDRSLCSGWHVDVRFNDFFSIETYSVYYYE